MKISKTHDGGFATRKKDVPVGQEEPQPNLHGGNHGRSTRPQNRGEGG